MMKLFWLLTSSVLVCQDTSNLAVSVEVDFLSNTGLSFNETTSADERVLVASKVLKKVWSFVKNINQDRLFTILKNELELSGGIELGLENINFEQNLFPYLTESEQQGVVGFVDMFNKYQLELAQAKSAQQDESVYFNPSQAIVAVLSEVFDMDNLRSQLVELFLEFKSGAQDILSQESFSLLSYYLANVFEFDFLSRLVNANLNPLRGEVCKVLVSAFDEVFGKEKQL